MSSRCEVSIKNSPWCIWSLVYISRRFSTKIRGESWLPPSSIKCNLLLCRNCNSNSTFQVYVSRYIFTCRYNWQTSIVCSFESYKYIVVAGSLLDATCNNLRNRLLRGITIKSKLLNMCVCNTSSINPPQITYDVSLFQTWTSASEWFGGQTDKSIWTAMITTSRWKQDGFDVHSTADCKAHIYSIEVYRSI